MHTGHVFWDGCGYAVMVTASNKLHCASIPVHSDFLKSNPNLTDFCNKCNELFPLSVMREHTQVCTMNVTIEKEDAAVIDLTTTTTACLDSDDEEHVYGTEVIPLSPGHTKVSILGDCDSLPPDAQLKEVLDAAAQFLRGFTEYSLEARRHAVLCDCLKAVDKTVFHPSKRIKVDFVGELGDDYGGPRRELWRLLAADVKASLCHGPDCHKTLLHNADGLKDGLFFKVGVLMGCSLINGGYGYPFFTPAIYQYIAGTPLKNVTASADHVPSLEIRDFLRKISAVEDEEQLRDILIDGCDVLQDAGCTRPIRTAKLEEKDALIGAVCLHHYLLSIKAELDELIDRIKSTGLLDYIRRFLLVFEGLFTCKDTHRLTAESILQLIPPVNRTYSEPGSSSRIREENTYITFRDLLDELEAGDQEAQLSDVLIFWTGASTISPLGYDSNPSLHFSEGVFPTASTCALSLVLPTTHHNDYVKFKKNCIYAFLHHGGFGLV